MKNSFSEIVSVVRPEAHSEIATVVFASLIVMGSKKFHFGHFLPSNRPPLGRHSRKYVCCEFHKKKNALTRGNNCFVSAPFFPRQIDPFLRVSVQMESLSVRRNRPILELRASRRMDGRACGRADAILKKLFSKTPFQQKRGEERALAPSALVARSHFLLLIFCLLTTLVATQQEGWLL